MTMSDSADPMYEELNKKIADLRKIVGERDSKIAELQTKLQGNTSELIDSELKYRQLMKDSFNAINESNKTIAKLVDSMDRGSDRW